MLLHAGGSGLLQPRLAVGTRPAARAVCWTRRFLGLSVAVDGCQQLAFLVLQTILDDLVHPPVLGCTCPDLLGHSLELLGSGVGGLEAILPEGDGRFHCLDRTSGMGVLVDLKKNKGREIHKEMIETASRND